MLRNFVLGLGIKIGSLEITDENGITTTGWIIAAFIIVVAAYAAYCIIQEVRKTKEGENSSEKQRVAQIVSEIAKGEQVTAAFAHWSTVERQANRTITRYWWYAVGFNKERIYVAPISISSSKPRNITYSNSFVLEPDVLGLVNGDKGKSGSTWMEAYDKEGNKIVSLMLADSYTDSSLSDYLVNITQKEAWEKWVKETVPYWMEKVNTANGTTATGHYNNAKALDLVGQGANVHGGGKAKNF